MSALRTVVIGSGNVASCVVPALEGAGAVSVCAVYSPTPGHADKLAARLPDACACNRPSDVPRDAELYLVAVKDDAITAVAEAFAPYISGDAVWLHTSGGVAASALSPLTPNFGVFYPLQTFSKGVELDLSVVPVFVEGATPEAVATARRLGEAISKKVYEVDSQQRARLHAAAVFACNFTNHLWAIADDILRRETPTDLSVLYPLIQETMRKAMIMRPADGQTGPARRGDRQVIERHCSLLKPDESNLYRILSDHIISYYELD